MNLRLRAVELSDANLIYEWENTYSLWGVSSTRAPFSRYAIENYVQNAQNDDIFSVKQMRFMIDIEEGGRVYTIGCADLYDLEPQHLRAGVGIYIAEGEFRRKNVAFNSLEWIWNYAKNILNIHQLYAYITEDNIPSSNLFLKAGYQKTATLKNWMKKGDNYYDVFVYQKISNQ
ncbi:MAG: GNAT family protein [Bacteroidales bacterium]|nr:GNAT family N-acetyltransferase [Bacteroidales bacterium]